MTIPFSALSRGIAALSLIGSLAVGSSQALATDGTWILNGNGNWNTQDGNPWQGGTVASGTGASAYFNTIDITANRTVTLTEDITVGNLYFGDTALSPTAYNTWTVNRLASQVLTLQTSAGTPTITVDNSSATILAPVAGNQGLAKAGSGTVTLSGNNTFTGTVTVGAGAMTLAGTNVFSNAVVNAGALTLSGANSSLGSVVVNAGTLTLSGANSSLSSVTVNGGTLDVWTTNAIGNNNISLVAASSTLNAANTATSVITINGNITGSGKISKTSGVSTLVLNGNNTFTGGTTIGAGTVALGTGLNNGLGTGTLTMNGGSALLSTDNNSRTINNTLAFGSGNFGFRFGATEGDTTGKGNLTFAGTGTVSVGGARTWTVNNNTRVTFKNAWSGNSGWDVTKAGTGTLVFDGNITGSNGVGIIVNAGTMLINGSKSSTSNVTVNSGGTLGGNSPSMAGVFTVFAGGAIAPGDGGIGTLTATNLSWNGETSGAFAQMKFDLSNVGGQGSSATSDRLALGSGILTKQSGSVFAFDFLGSGAAGNTYTLMTFGSSSGFSVSDFSYTNLTNGLTGTFGLNAGSLTFSVVPEPTTFALLGAGLMVTFFARRRRRD
ncbi:PEP-CTERM protein-sorting domain-containing protein [Terrimicrobium sacchariphilum]|uniref:PEP-CTERM protein-sorting domain-containing protein n=1 Tax=Terrimicrobium sacchariphilum TaxID=690879 RepID=A0A146GBX7_TERSA|nr:autotransporter-associated beta strand repeat-containing protein [Terrimicrobium sacchariphilum]GAT34672.1 PEP-CTERM protein-sorting domain-containing protein [Terrimicrobium sacchariphilum]